MSDTIRDEDRTREQLLVELAALRAQVERIPPYDDREIRLRTLLEHSPDVICVIGRDGRILYVNKVREGFTLESVIGTPAGSFAIPDDRARYEAALAEVWRSGEHQRFEFTSVSAFAWEMQFVPLKDGQVVYAVMAIAADVTQRKRAERALEESEAKLRLALTATGISLWKWDFNQGELQWDGAAAQLFELAADELPRSNEAFLRYIDPVDRARVAEAMDRASTSLAPVDVEHLFVTARGTRRSVVCKGAPTRNAAGELTGVMGGIFDVTAQRRLEEQLRHSQKMEALGQLTAGIAHNFNNMLTVVLSNLSVCEGKVQEPMRQRLRAADHAAHRAADMVRELMVFSRRHPPAAKRPTDVREIVQRTCDICATTFDKNIMITADVPERSPRVLADAGQLEQVLLNLCLNARDALEEQGNALPRIDLMVAQRTRGAATGDAEGQTEDIVTIRVRDNGPGMSEAVRTRVFEPFFTTKEVGRGTGLGLATAYGILADHGGEIVCESQLGVGSTFTMSLPMLPPQAAQDEDGPAAPPPSAAPLLLVVEDDEMVRRTTARLLVASGFDVLEADSGQRAFEIFAQEASRIDLVLLDWSMPQLSGDAVLRGLIRMRPDVAVVLFSGQHPGIVLPDNVRAVIYKPSPIESVVRTLREVLPTVSS